MTKGENHGLDWLKAIILLFPYFIVVGLFQLLAYALLGIKFDHSDHEISEAQRVGLSFFTLLATVVVVYLFQVRLDKAPFIDLGFKLRKRVKDISTGLLTGLLVISLAFITLILTGSITIDSFQVDYLSILLTFLLFTFVSLSEEIFFRGYILKNFMNSFNKYVALILTSLLFSSLHLFNDDIELMGFVNLFLLGLALGITYIFNQNLWYPIALHFSWNFFQAILGFKVSGNTFYSIFIIQQHGQSLLHGGEFGLEGSIILSIVTVILIIISKPVFSRFINFSNDE